MRQFNKDKIETLVFEMRKAQARLQALKLLDKQQFLFGLESANQRTHDKITCKENTTSS